MGAGTVAHQEKRLPFLGAITKDSLDVRAESDIQHAIGFVKDHTMNGLEIQRFALNVIENSTGSSHNDLGPFPKLFNLFSNWLAAIYRNACDFSSGCQFRELVAHLNR